MRTPISLSAMLLAGMASTGAAEPMLHVGNAYDDCYFELHPELTQAEFEEFTKEGSMLVHDSQLASAEALGRGVVHVMLDYSSTAIDDSKGAWNNTMSHPAADHYLGDRLAFPRLGVRVGVASRVDVGAWGTLNPTSNYGFLGVETKVTALRQDEAMPVSVAIRPNLAALLGPDDLFVADFGIDLSVSRSYKGLAPYVGLSGHSAAAIERSPNVDLDAATPSYTTAFGGVSYQWRKLFVAGQAETGPMTTYAMRLSGTF
jgi:hypothetical protein